MDCPEHEKCNIDHLVAFLEDYIARTKEFPLILLHIKTKKGNEGSKTVGPSCAGALRSLVFDLQLCAGLIDVSSFDIGIAAGSERLRSKYIFVGDFEEKEAESYIDSFVDKENEKLIKEIEEKIVAEQARSSDDSNANLEELKKQLHNLQQNIVTTKEQIKQLDCRMPLLLQELLTCADVNSRDEYWEQIELRERTLWESFLLYLVDNSKKLQAWKNALQQLAKADYDKGLNNLEGLSSDDVIAFHDKKVVFVVDSTFRFGSRILHSIAKEEFAKQKESANK